MKKLQIAIILLVAVSLIAQPYSYASKGSRPAYVYDNADIITSRYEQLLDDYLRNLDDATSAEIVIWTTTSFYGHGIMKDGQEIHDRDMLANYIFNEVSLNGITGIGKKGKDNGILILYSMERDSSGGSMRIEIGRGLEGEITDGTAGAILDSYLVPARTTFQQTGDTSVFDQAFSNTVITLAEKIGYSSNESAYKKPEPVQDETDIDSILPILPFIAIFILAFILSRRRRRRGFYGGFYGGGFGGGGGGFGGGGGGSGGGGAGR